MSQVSISELLALKERVRENSGSLFMNTAAAVAHVKIAAATEPPRRGQCLDRLLESLYAELDNEALTYLRARGLVIPDDPEWKT